MIVSVSDGDNDFDTLDTLDWLRKILKFKFMFGEIFHMETNIGNSWGKYFNLDLDLYLNVWGNISDGDS